MEGIPAVDHQAVEEALLRTEKLIQRRVAVDVFSRRAMGARLLFFQTTKIFRLSVLVDEFEARLAVAVKRSSAEVGFES